jgi:hypothetical protein
MDMLFALGSNLVLGALLLPLAAWLLRPDGARLADDEQAAATFARQLPARVGRVARAADGRAALLELDGPAVLGILERRGRRWNARAVAPADVRAVHAAADGVLTIEFRDFGWPAARVALADHADRDRWMARLRGEVATAREATRAG